MGTNILDAIPLGSVSRQGLFINPYTGATQVQEWPDYNIANAPGVSYRAPNVTVVEAVELAMPAVDTEAYYREDGFDRDHRSY